MKICGKNRDIFEFRRRKGNIQLTYQGQLNEAQFKIKTPSNKILRINLKNNEQQQIIGESGKYRIRSCHTDLMYELKIIFTAEITREFTGTLPVQNFSLLNSKNILHQIDLSDAIEGKFTLQWTEVASLQLYVFTTLSPYNVLNTNFFTLINAFINPDNMRYTGTFISGIREINIPQNEFSPDRYIIQVSSLFSQTAVNYTLTVKYTAVISDFEQFDIVGFWECSTRMQNLALNIRQRKDGAIYVQYYTGDSFSGFTLLSIKGKVFLNINGGYLDYQGIFEDIGTYYYPDFTDNNRLISFLGGVNNPINEQEFYNIYTRVEKPNIIEWTPKNFQDIETPTNLFKKFFNSYFLQLNSHFVKDAVANDYPGLNTMNTLFQQILDTGITETFEAIDVWPEMTTFGPGFPSNPGDPRGPIKVYAPFTIKNAIVQAEFFFGINEISFIADNNDLEIFMVVQLSGFKGVSNTIPGSWINGLYRVEFIQDIGSPTGEQIIYLSAFGGVLRQPFVGRTTWQEKEITIKPRSFRLRIPNMPFVFGYDDSNNPSLLKFEGFSNIGGIDEKHINRRYTLYYQDYFAVGPTRDMFINFDDDIDVKFTETGGGFGIVRVSNFPSFTRNSLLVNFNAQLYPSCPLTLIFTTIPTLTSSWSLLKIDGLRGDYQRLNGIHEAHPFSSEMTNCNTIPTIWNDKCYPSDRRYPTALKLDTLDLPPFIPAIHCDNGKSFTIQKIVARLTDDSNYGDFADACCHLYKKSGVNTHSGILFHLDVVEGKRNPSWKDIQNLIDVGNIDSLMLTRNRPAIDPIGGTFLYQGFSEIINTNCNNLNNSAITAGSIDPERRMDITDLNIWYIPPTHRTYLNRTQVYRSYLSIQPPVLNDRIPGSDPNKQNISNNLIPLGYNDNGTLVTYESKNLPILLPGSIKLTQNTPTQRQFLMRNSFSRDGFILKEISGEFILADPPIANIPLRNASACNGRIVVIIDDSTSKNVKYQNCVNAGAIAVIISNFFPFINFNYAQGSIPGGPINNIMIYSINNPDADVFTGFRGGLRSNGNNYNMPRSLPTPYSGNISSHPMLVGSPETNFSIIRPEFSNGKDIGFFYLHSTLTFTPAAVEINPLFYDNYKQDTLIDQMAKLSASILSTQITTNSGEIKRFSELDTIIIDNSNNTGGLVEFIIAFSCFFGQDRPTINSKVPVNGNGQLISLTNSQLLQNVQTTPTIASVFPAILPCSKYQNLYPDAVFKGSKVIIITSTNAFSTGDVVPHFFRNVNNPESNDIGGGVTSYIVGTIDGRLQGYAGRDFLSNPPNRSSLLSTGPLIAQNNCPIYAYLMYGEERSFPYNTGSNQTICSQVSEINIDDGPIKSGYEEEAGIYAAFGFTNTYPRNNEKYARFNQVIGLPRPYQVNSYHYPFLEDAILLAVP